MALLNHIHRDMLHRVIKHEDIVVWSNGKYNQKMRLARVVDTTPQKVRIQLIDSQTTTLARPKNLIVISAQIAANLEGNVGANMDMEATR
ncbi:hypothetical protein PQC34_gp052 [Cronobacter phage A24]|uniref:Uncharacterized protein n=1 Tax=Cronobacter phage A24 TaxID=2795745 RepID=A0A7T5QXQ0_9CAUD|nr:hypothetical protein PQC34_gp052 [Cronobacter phage A24]QQG33682.1 hypothetical protein [Cronobacter phage A24]